MTLADDPKSAARSSAFARRRAAHAGGQGAACDHLTAALAPRSGRVLAGYLPIRTEIDPRPAMAVHDGPVCVPVVVGPGRPLRFRAWTPETPLVPGAFGAPVPMSGEWLTPEVLIVPLLAFDGRGYRLGYGGGFYDRTLADLRAHRPVIAIGFAFAAQQVETVPTDAFDQPLDAVITEAGPLVIAFSQILYGGAGV